MAANGAKCAKLILFRAHEGRSAEYDAYLHASVEPIDREAVKEGALLDMLTLVNDPAGNPVNAPGAADASLPWTHMRIFLFESEAQRASVKDAFARIAPKIQPNEAVRKSRKAYGESLRTLVVERDVGVLG